MSELAAHLLAQLPDDVTLACDEALLARAYGVDERAHGPPVAPDRPFAELADELGDARPAAVRRGDDAVLAGHRVAVLTNVPMHYRVPLFASLQERLGASGCALRVLFAAEAPADRPWVGSRELAFDHELHSPRALRRFAPTIVLAGGFDPAAMRAALHARRHGAAFGIWSGAVASPLRERSRLRALQRRLLLGQASFAIAYGIAARDYLRGLAPRLPVAIGRNTSVERAEGGARARDGELRLLTVGRLHRQKALEVAIAAVRLRPQLRCRLTIVGDGPERERLRAAAGGDPRVVFTGALAPDEARAAYRDADAFLFPTREDIFGHVLVEAMAAGLPAIVAASAGAADDLCADGRNAIVVPTHEPDDWARAIDHLASDPELASRLGARAAATVQARWTLAHAADATVAGLRLGALAADGGR